MKNETYQLIGKKGEFKELCKGGKPLTCPFQNKVVIIAETSTLAGVKPVQQIQGFTCNEGCAMFQTSPSLTENMPNVTLNCAYYAEYFNVETLELP
jgi:hypothetical protein